MKKCVGCGSTIENKQRYCMKCGMENQRVSKGLKSSVRKTLALLAIIIVIGAFGGNYYLKQTTSPSLVIKPIHNAIVNEDMAMFANGVGLAKAEESTVQGLLDYINEQDMEKFLKQLTESGEAVHEKGLTKIITHEDGTELFLIQKRMKFGLYPYIELQAVKNFDEVVATSKEPKNVKMTSVNGEEKEVMPLKEINEVVLYSWEVTNGEIRANLHLIMDGGTTEEVEFTSTLGEEGDREYTGQLQFYLAEEDEQIGVLQDHLSANLRDASVNLEKSPFQEYIFENQTMITMNEIEATNIGSLTMWAYADGEIGEVNFDGESQITISEGKVKFIGTEYLQTYTYNNGGNEEVGWDYTTWKWDTSDQGFKEYDITRFIVEDEFDRESGESTVKMWQEMANYYVGFPEIELTKKVIDLAKKGMLLDNSIHLGKSIDEVIEEFPNYTADGYFEGGYYYSYPGGISYFIDEETREISLILLSGQVIMNDFESLDSILGQRYDEYKSDEEDQAEFWSIVDYHLGENKVRIELNEEDEINGIRLSKQDD